MSRTPPRWLQDGDTVEVFLEGVGTCSNTIRFEPRTQEPYTSD